MKRFYVALVARGHTSASPVTSAINNLTDYARRKLRKQMLGQMPLCEKCQQAYATDLHEVKTRARGGSILDPENIVVLCRPCHSWITTNPTQAKEQGWLKNSWDN